jgi:excisionase family DNA binding protein
MTSTSRLTPAEAADYLGCAVGLVYKLCKAKQLAHYRLGTGRGRIVLSKDDLDAYLAGVKVLPQELSPMPAPKPLKLVHLKLGS